MVRLKYYVIDIIEINGMADGVVYGNIGQHTLSLNVVFMVLISTYFITFRVVFEESRVGAGWEQKCWRARQAMNGLTVYLLNSIVCVDGRTSRT